MNQGGGAWMVTHIPTHETDTLSSIERLVFDDFII